MLEAYLRQKREQQEILLMTHIVLGYPNFETSLRLVETMVESGVELMELQIPFSEPIADGPVILRANQLALNAGSTVARCFQFATEVAQRFPIPFLFMSYYNVLFKHGTPSFVRRMAEAGLKGYESSQWYGLWAPANLPPDLVAKLQQEAAKAMKSPQVAKALLEYGFMPSGSTPEEFKTYIRQESAKYAKLIKAANIRLEN